MVDRRPPAARPTRGTTAAQRRAIRAVAGFEAFKGLLVLVTATGLLAWVHRDLEGWAARWVEHAHLNPAARYPHIFLDLAQRLQDTRLWLLALGAGAYCTLRFVEAYGLYRERAWAEVLAAASGAVYLPIELIEWVRHPSWLRATLFALNAAVVALMLVALMRRRQRRADPSA